MPNNIKSNLFASLAKGGGCNLLHSEGLEKLQGRRVLAIFGTFRLLLRGSTHVQHPFAKNEIYLTFSKSYKTKSVGDFNYLQRLIFLHIFILCKRTFFLFNALVDEHKHNYTHYYTAYIRCCLRPNYALKSDKLIHNK